MLGKIIDFISGRYNVERTKFIANSKIEEHFDDVDNGFAILVETEDENGSDRAKEEWKRYVLGGK